MNCAELPGIRVFGSEELIEYIFALERQAPSAGIDGCLSEPLGVEMQNELAAMSGRAGATGCERLR